MSGRHAASASRTGGHRSWWPLLAAVLLVSGSAAGVLLLIGGGTQPPRTSTTLTERPTLVDDGARPVRDVDAEPAATKGGEPATPPAGSPSPSSPPAVVPARGDGVLTPLDVPSSSVPASAGRRVTYSVEVEGGLGVDTVDFAADVASVLSDARSWQPVEGISLVPVAAAEVAAGTPVDLRVTLASPGLTDELCAPLQTQGEVSCWNGERAVLNAKRWVLGAPTYGQDVATYRIYVINHEVGHGLGHAHVDCPAAGQPAPVMMQQTVGLDGCTPWPWPTSP